MSYPIPSKIKIIVRQQMLDYCNVLSDLIDIILRYQAGIHFQHFTKDNDILQQHIKVPIARHWERKMPPIRPESPSTTVYRDFLHRKFNHMTWKQPRHRESIWSQVVTSLNHGSVIEWTANITTEMDVDGCMFDKHYVVFVLRKPNNKRSFRILSKNSILNLNWNDYAVQKYCLPCLEFS